MRNRRRTAKATGFDVVWSLVRRVWMQRWLDLLNLERQVLADEVLCLRARAPLATLLQLDLHRQVLKVY